VAYKKALESQKSPKWNDLTIYENLMWGGNRLKIFTSERKNKNEKEYFYNHHDSVCYRCY
jgi:hypothetical protein